MKSIPNQIAKGIIRTDLLTRKILRLKKPKSPYYIDKQGVVRRK